MGALLHGSGAKLSEEASEVYCSMGCCSGQGYRPKPPNCEHPLARIHVDVRHVPVEIVDPEGPQYVLTILDEFTGFNEVYGITARPQISSNLVFYIKHSNRCFSHHRLAVRELWLDTAYLDEDLKEFCDEMGIPCKNSVDPAENRAKPLGRKIQELASINLRQSLLPKKYWIMALKYSSYNCNLIPVDEDHKLPLEAWHGGINPKLFSYLAPFGCRMTALKPVDVRLGRDSGLVQAEGNFVGNSDRGGYLVHFKPDLVIPCSWALIEETRFGYPA